MIIKKFQATTEQEAILLANEELGKEAIIMNIKTVKPKGLRKLFQKEFVEVTAAMDDTVTVDNEKIISKIRQIQESQKIEQKEEMAWKKNILEEPVEEKEQDTTAIEEKLNSLQLLLEKQVKEEKEVEQQTKQNEKEEEKHSTYVELVYQQLISNEMDETYAKQLIKEVEKSFNKETSIGNVLASVYQKIVLKLGQTKTITLTEGTTKFIFFIGPTGVGKTTTIAKIASSFKLGKKAKVALVTSDTYRIAAVEQLRTYANILGIPIKVVYSGRELKEVKQEFEGYDLVFIDTAGRSHKNREQRDDLEELLAAIPEEEKETYLVLSATTKYKDLLKITNVYKELTDYNLIFTKLDETICYGNIYNIKMVTGVPLSYTTYGQNVPDDIGRLDAQDIAKQLLGRNE